MSTHSFQRNRRALLLGALASGLAGRSFAAASPQDVLKPLHEAAQRAGEKQINVYTPYLNTQPIWDAFKRDYPEYSISFPLLFGPPLFARLDAEKASGNYAGDLILNAYLDLQQLISESRLEAFVPAAAAGLAPQYRDAGGHFHVPFTAIYSLLYNTNLVPAGSVPSSLREVLSAKWKGRITHQRITGNGILDYMLAALARQNIIGPADLPVIKDHAVPVDSMNALLGAVGQGRFAMGLFAASQSALPLITRGAPMKMAYLGDSSVRLGPGVALLQNAPHRNSAMLLANWLFTPRGQAAIATTYTYGTMPGAPTPRNMPDIPHAVDQLPIKEALDATRQFRLETAKYWKS